MPTTTLSPAARLFRRYQAESMTEATAARRTYGTRCAAANWDRATTQIAFEAAEAAGLVRLRVEPDVFCTLEGLEGDMFTPDVWPHVSDRTRGEARAAFRDKVNREGVWHVAGEYFDGETWQFADSCGGFVGDDWQGSGYDTDIQRATLDALAAVTRCPCCNRPHRPTGGR